MGHSCARPRQAGFTYVGLMVLVAIIGLVGAAALKADALLRRAAAERELLEIGAAFGEALRSYAEATPRGQPQQPPTLQELLRDPRFPGVRRHLRKIFVDPVSGRAEWGIVYAAGERGVLAVYSLSRARPLKVANFDARFPNFENKEHLSDWKFAATGQGVTQMQAPQPNGAQPDGTPGNGAQPGQPPASLFPNQAAPGQAVPPPSPIDLPPPAPADAAPAPPPPDNGNEGRDGRSTTAEQPEQTGQEERDEKRDEKEETPAPRPPSATSER